MTDWIKACLHVLSTSPFFVNGTFDLFDITCKQLYRTRMNSFLNDAKNGDIDGTCKRSLRGEIWCTEVIVFHHSREDFNCNYLTNAVNNMIVFNSQKFNYHPQTKLQKGNVFTSVCQEFCPVVYPSMHWGRHPLADAPGQTLPLPGSQHPPWADTPPRQPLQRTVRILLECILVFLLLTKFHPL